MTGAGSSAPRGGTPFYAVGVAAKLSWLTDCEVHSQGKDCIFFTPFDRNTDFPNRQEVWYLDGERRVCIEKWSRQHQGESFNREVLYVTDREVRDDLLMIEDEVAGEMASARSMIRKLDKNGWDGVTLVPGIVRIDFGECDIDLAQAI